MFLFRFFQSKKIFYIFNYVFFYIFYFLQALNFSSLCDVKKFFKQSIIFFKKCFKTSVNFNQYWDLMNYENHDKVYLWNFYFFYWFFYKTFCTCIKKIQQIHQLNIIKVIKKHYKKARERYQRLSKEEKGKRNNIVVNDTKIYQKWKNKICFIFTQHDLLCLENNIVKWEKNVLS